MSRRKARHDARSALNQILGYGEMLQERAEEEDLGDWLDDLRRIDRAGRTLLGLIDELAPPDQLEAASPPREAPAPLAAPLASPLPSSSPAPLVTPEAQAAVPADRGSLLVVDDNELNRDMLSRRLKRRGYTVATADGGRTALQMLRSETFDLVLLDVMMPDIDGIEVLRTIRRDVSAGDLPVIMATAKDTSEDVVEALEIGANDYVTKPLDIPVVTARVEAQLAAKRARDEIKQLHQRLVSAQEKINALMETSGTALDDLSAWCTSAAADLADAVGARQVAVWTVTDGTPEAITGLAVDPPTPDQIQQLVRTGQRLVTAGGVLQPVMGLGGALFGVLGVAGAALDDTADRLLDSFARQLGGALELRHTRSELDAAKERKRLQRQEMLDRGVELLHICPQCLRCYPHEVLTCEDDAFLLDRPAPFPYRVADRYRLTRVAGKGGMGLVYFAVDERLDREVAIKVILREHFDNESLRRRFGNEARTVARIAHPGVIAVYDSGELDDGSMFIVMERLDGLDLKQLIQRDGAGSADQVASLIEQGAAALAAAHDVGLIHRDIKPDNLFLVPDDGWFRVKVLDFGIAKEIDAETRLTQTGVIIGTPAYMSPEQILCKPLDGRSDLYSFAAVAYRALCDRPVTLRKKFAEVLLDVTTLEPPPVTTLRRDLPAAIDDVFAAALAKKPDERPATVGRWAEQVTAILGSVEDDVPGWRLGAGQLRRERAASSPAAPARDTGAATSARPVLGDGNNAEPDGWLRISRLDDDF